MNFHFLVPNVAVSVIPINYIFDLFSPQAFKANIVTPEFIDDQFTGLIYVVANKILDHDFESVIELFNELLTREMQLKNHQSDLFLLNNKDYSKLLLYEVNYLHGRVIDMIVDYIQHSYREYRSQLQSNSSNASEIKTSCLGMVGHFIYYLITKRSLNVTEIDYYIRLLSETIELFKL